MTLETLWNNILMCLRLCLPDDRRRFQSSGAGVFPCMSTHRWWPPHPLCPCSWIWALLGYQHDPSCWPLHSTLLRSTPLSHPGPCGRGSSGAVKASCLGRARSHQSVYLRHLILSGWIRGKKSPRVTQRFCPPTCTSPLNPVSIHRWSVLTALPRLSQGNLPCPSVRANRGKDIKDIAR